MHLARHREHDVLGHRLDARREIHVPLLDGGLRASGRAAEQLVERRARHRQALAVVEVPHVHPEAAVGPEIDQMLRDEVAIDRPAVRREAHQLVFAAVHLEAAVVRERGVQETERVGELELAREGDPVAAAHAHRRRRPFADAVEREDGRFVERAGEERARGVALVVVGEHDRRADAAANPAPDQPGLLQLLAEPHRHGRDEAREPGRGVREIGFEQPLELAQRLLVEDDIVEVLDRDLRFAEAVLDRQVREAGIVLLAGEALLLRGRHDLPVAHEAGRAVVIERRNAQNVRHVRSPLLLDSGGFAAANPQRARRLGNASRVDSG